MELHEVREATVRTELAAEPVQRQVRTSPWLTVPKRALSGVHKVIGPSKHKANAGCCTWLNAVYWIRVMDKRPNGDLLIENLHDVGKIKVKHVQAVIESDLVYPLLRGRDVQRWHAEPSAHIIVANRSDKLAGIPEPEMKRRYPKTFAYLKQFEGDAKKPVRGTLRGRSGYRQYFKPSDPFYSIYNIGPYSMTDWKVVWREQSSFFQAAFVGPESGRAVLPDHKLMMVACSSQQEADFILAMLNSRPSLLAIHSYVISTSTSTHVLENIAVPRLEKRNNDHAALAKFARQCHAAAAKGDAEAVAFLETEIDITAAKIWGITDDELSAIRDALAELGLARAETADEIADE